MRHSTRGIRTNYEDTDLKRIRRHLRKTYKRGIRVGTYLSKEHDGSFRSRVMVYTNECDWLEYKLKHGHELDKAVSTINSFMMASGSMSMQAIGRGMRQHGKSAMTTLYVAKALREGKTVGYMNLEMKLAKMELNECVHKDKPAMAQ